METEEILIDRIIKAYDSCEKYLYISENTDSLFKRNLIISNEDEEYIGQEAARKLKNVFRVMKSITDEVNDPDIFTYQEGKPFQIPEDIFEYLIKKLFLNHSYGYTLNHLILDDKKGQVVLFIDVEEFKLNMEAYYQQLNKHKKILIDAINTIKDKLLYFQRFEDNILHYLD